MTSLPPQHSAPPTHGISADDIRDGKVMAVLSYALTFIKLPFFLIPLCTGSSRFATYHAKQCAMLWIVTFVLSIICIPFCFICIGFPMLIIVGVGSLVLNILGTISASNGDVKPLPIIGRMTESLFGGERGI